MIKGSAQRLAERLTAEAGRAHQATVTIAQPPPPPPSADGAEHWAALMKRCNRPDASAEDVAALRARLAERPDVADIVAPFAQLLDHELGRVGNVLTRELKRARVTNERAALGYDAAPALERPLIDHLLLCEERLADAERYLSGVSATAGLPFRQLDYAERRLNGAQSRYLRAVETLARVRRVRVELARVTAPDGTRAESVAVEGPGR